MLQRGELVMTSNGRIGLILAIFDAIVYQPSHAELLIESKVVMIPCSKLQRMPDTFHRKTLEELINYESAKERKDIIRKKNLEYYYNFKEAHKT